MCSACSRSVVWLLALIKSAGRLPSHVIPVFEELLESGLCAAFGSDRMRKTRLEVTSTRFGRHRCILAGS